MPSNLFAAALFFSTNLLAVAPACVAMAQDSEKTLCFHTQWVHYADRAEKQTVGFLLRELPRQAMLIAARDELRLPVRDESLGEAMLEDDSADHLMLAEAAFKSERTIYTRLLQFQFEQAEEWTLRPSEQPATWEGKCAFRPGAIPRYKDLVPRLEQASRTDYVDALKKAGYERSDRKVDPISPKVEEGWQVRLLEVDMVTQFAVLRECHQAIAASGETPERLGVLARGYANLALMTNHHWTTMTYAYAARSMLYAQRMVAVSGETPTDQALWHRAYSWAIVGFHHNAISDFQELAERGSTGEAWTKLAERYCEFDREVLAELGDEQPGLNPWAQRLKFQIAASMRYPHWMYVAGGEVARVAPMAYGVYSEMARYGGSLATTRTGAEYGPRAFGYFLPISVYKIPNLPEVVREIVPTTPEGKMQLAMAFKDPEPRDAFTATPVAFAERFRQADNTDRVSTGLSWSALASLLDEECFIQIALSFYVAQNATESSHAKAVDAVLPFIKSHRYAAYVDSYRYSYPRERDAVKKTVQDIYIIDLRDSMRPMSNRVCPLLKSAGERIGGMIGSQTWDEYNLQGLVESTLSSRLSARSWAKAQAHRLNSIIPNAELGLRITVSLAEDPPLEEIAEWEAAITKDPLAIQKLGELYSKKNLKEDAIRCFESANELLPSFIVNYRLAQIYWDQKDYDRWEQTLVDFLDHDDSTSDSYAAHNQLALGLYKLANFERAQPHADAAAQMWSAWGLQTGSTVHEALGNWKESELYIREKSQSYPTNSGDGWYWWCCRTGRGDRVAALKLADDHLSIEPSKPDSELEIKRGVRHLLEGDHQKARAAYQKSLNIAPRYSATYMVAQLSRKLGDEPARNAVIQAFRDHLAAGGEGNTHQGIVDAGLALLDLIDNGELTPTTAGEITDLVRAIKDDVNRCSFAYFAAMEFQALGDNKTAESLLIKVLRMPSGSPLYQTLAGQELCQVRGGASRADDDQLGLEDFWGGEDMFANPTPD